jgi:hypothetical protein
MQPRSAKYSPGPSTTQTLAINLINAVPTRAEDLTALANSHSNTMDLCIQKYDGLSV